MRNFIVSVLILLSFHGAAQEGSYKRIIPSLTDWIEEINTWPDSVYQVENIKIRIDPEKDSLVIGTAFEPGWDPEKIVTTVNKAIRVSHWEFENFFGSVKVVGLANIRFKGAVRLSDYQGLGFAIQNSIFEGRFSISDQGRYSYYSLISCRFEENVGFFDFTAGSGINIVDSHFKDLQVTRSSGRPDLYIEESSFERLFLIQSQLMALVIRSSKVADLALQDGIIESAARLLENDIDFIEVSGAQLPLENTYIPFADISGKLYVDPVSNTNRYGNKYYVTDTLNFGQWEEYDLLLASYKLLLNRYQNRGDQDSYNACYVEMKDIETRRLAYLHEQNPGFRSYFTWKINHFLKVFSAYGTEPARAIIVSLYVILLFALIYLFFPNSWDAHGKNRILDRYRFFFKYLQRDAGVHEVYLEEKQPELLGYDEFRSMITGAGKSVPRFFSATALPLYHWAVSGTRLSATILGKVDILKGSWADLPAGQKMWKSLLLVAAFLVALAYDLTIKVLNALMLSINTFTTLGFGEIPIRGLPRYLAIIQGFIGWFMLTIFSVSLISQLLN